MFLGRKKFYYLVIFILSLLVVQIVQAATIFLSPSSGAFGVGKIIGLDVIVNSADQAMNAASGIISFPQDKLEVMSVSRANSIITFWLKEPSFSNQAGTVRFEGVVLNPGFTGKAGKIFTINFKVKAEGAAKLSFSSGAVLANDGNGTSILSGLGSGNFILGRAEEVDNRTETVGLPSKPKIVSDTNPNQDEYSNNNNVKLSWNLPNGVDGVSLSLLPGEGKLNTRSEGRVDKFDKKIEDGIWYFYVRLRNNQGWGEAGSYKLLIDTKAPENFSVEIIGGEKVASSSVKVKLRAFDSLSGLDHYGVIIAKKEMLFLATSSNDVYDVPGLNPGSNEVEFIAFDKAGNKISLLKNIDFTPPPVPEFIEYPKNIEENEVLIIEGRSILGGLVELEFEKNVSKEIERNLIKPDSKGKFFFIKNKAAPGLYKVRAKTVGKGVESEFSEDILIKVDNYLLKRLVVNATMFVVIIAPFLYILFVVVIISLYFLKKIKDLKLKLRRDINKIEFSMHKDFSLLRSGIYKQIKYLENIKNVRSLSKKEGRILRSLKKNLSYIEKKIGKELEAIEKDLK